jgi:Ring finger domain
MSCVNLATDFNAELDNECVICYETIGKTNCCVTPCGHHFCFKCLMKSMERNDGCPMCREPLQDPSDDDEEDDSENDYVYEDSDDESSEADDEDGGVRTHRYLLATQAPPEIVAKRLSDMGYTMSDLIALYTGFINNDGKYNADFLDPMEEDVHMVIREEGANATKEFNEREAFMTEDTRRHSRLVPIPLLESADCGISILDSLFA